MDLQSSLKTCSDELDVLDTEFQLLDAANRNFCKTLNEMQKYQNECFKELKHQKYRISQIKDMLKKYAIFLLLINFNFNLMLFFHHSHKSHINTNEELSKIFKRIEQRNAQIKEIQDTLPKENGPYLNLVLGSINVNLLDHRKQFDYKEQYERFKLSVTCVLLLISFVNIITEFRFV